MQLHVCLFANQERQGEGRAPGSRSIVAEATFPFVGMVGDAATCFPWCWSPGGMTLCCLELQGSVPPLDTDLQRLTGSVTATIRTLSVETDAQSVYFPQFPSHYDLVILSCLILTANGSSKLASAGPVSPRMA